MTRHTLRLDPESGVTYCTECGAEFAPPHDVDRLKRDECRRDAPAAELIEVRTLDGSVRMFRGNPR